MPDIMIYDEESDRHVHISFVQALYASCYGAADGPCGDVFGLADMTENDMKRLDASYAKTLPASPRAVARASGSTATEGPTATMSCEAPMFSASAALPGESPAAKLKQFAEAAKEAHAKGDADKHEEALKVVNEIIKLVGMGVWVPVELVICRPFIEHLMLSAVVAVAGRDTGATLFGPAGKLPRNPEPGTSNPLTPHKNTLCAHGVRVSCSQTCRYRHAAMVEPLVLVPSARLPPALERWPFFS